MAAIKFITTKELGRLCKWLRIMGFDALYFSEAERRQLIIKSLQEERIILIARLEEELWLAIFTLRKKRIRIISVRKARNNEKEIYHSSRI